MPSRTNYKAQSKQILFHSAVADEVLYGGAAGGGKSTAILHDAVMKCLVMDDIRVAIFRRTFPELEKSIVFNFLSQVPQKFNGETIYEYSKKEHRAIFLINGRNSVLEFNHCQYEDDMHKYQSAEYDFIYFDELTHFTEKLYEYIGLSRLRTTKAGIKPQIKSGSNPGGVGHEWVKRRFVEGANPIYHQKDVTRVDNRESVDEYGIVTHFTTQFIPARVTDNLYLMKNDPDYINRLRRLPEDKRRGLLEGDWTAFEGQFFKEWRPEKHVVSPFSIPREWKRFRAMDWGYAKPCAVLWFALAPDKTLYVYRELYRTNMTVSELAATIKDMTIFMDDQTTPEPIAYTVADPSMWSVSQFERGESIAYKMIECGVSLIKADNNRISGWAALRDHLMFDDDRKPLLQIFSSCRELVRTLPQQVYDERRKEDIDTDGEDHLADALRYGIMSNPTITKQNPTYVSKPGTFEAHFKRMKELKRKEGYV